MTEWQPIETALEFMKSKGLDMLLERGAGINTWGNLILLCPDNTSRSESHVFIGKFVEWPDWPDNSHYRHADSYDDESLKPTHWTPLPERPK